MPSGMTTIAALTEDYPDATAKIQDLVVMGANICDDKVIYPPDVAAPVQETNAACDPTAANFIFSKEGPGKNFYVMPVGPGQGTIDGEYYQRVVQAAESGTCPSAAALLEMYFEWSEQASADDTILTHAEAIAYDPLEASALRYDPTAVFFAAQLLTKQDKTDDHVTHVEIPGLWFDDDAYTHIPNEFMLSDAVSDVCPTLTDLEFDLDDITDRRPLIVAIGYENSERHQAFLDDMADALSFNRDL